MFTFNARLVAGAVVSAALLAGCGGNSDNNNGGPPPGPAVEERHAGLAHLVSLKALDRHGQRPARRQAAQGWSQLGLPS